MLIKILAVGFGGMLGSILRYLTVKSIDERIVSALPAGTLVVNFAGSLILGAVFGLSISKAGISENFRLFMGTGICGGFTTFSAFSLENYLLLQPRPLLMVSYIAVSVLTGLIGVATGILLARSAG